MRNVKFLVLFFATVLSAFAQYAVTTDNTGTVQRAPLLLNNVTAPSTPASGKLSLYADSTSKNFSAKNDTGAVNHGIQTKTSVTNFFVTGIADDGTTAVSTPTGVVEVLNDSTLAALASAGSAIYRTSAGAWALSKADAQSTARVDAVVQSISSPNVTVVYSGKITLSSLSTGSLYYLSDATAGALTTTAPTTSTSYVTPVYSATSTTTALVNLPGYTALSKITNADMATMAANTIKSNLTGSTAAPSDNTLAAVSAALAPVPNAQTGTSYTLVIGDQNNSVSMSNAAANTLTVPLNASVAYPIGTFILVYQAGAGTTTIAATGGVTLNTAGSLSIGAQWGFATLYKIGTDTWTVSVGSSSATLTADSTTALTVSANADYVTTNNASTVTVTMPSLTSALAVSPVKVYRFKNLGAGLANVTAAGADTIFYLTSGNTVITLKQGESCDFIATSSQWLVR